MRVILVWMALLSPGTVLATLCDAYYPFEGSLQDTSGNGYHGELIDRANQPVAKAGSFVAGKVGQALQLQPGMAMRAPLDLNFEDCPQVTITAWVFFPDDQKGFQSIISTGFGAGPRLARSSNNIHGWAGGNEIREADALRAGLWIFVAGVWDYQAGIHRVYWRNRSAEELIGTNTRTPLPDFWVGGYVSDSTVRNFGINMRIDDLRVYGRVLSAAEIRQVQARNAPALRACACDDRAGSATSSGGSGSVAPALPAPTPIGPGGASTTPVVGSTVSAPPTPAIQLPQDPGLVVPDPDPAIANVPVSGYEICGAGGDCGAGGNSCFDVAVPAEGISGSMCTRTCVSDAECGAANSFAGACYALQGAPAVCYQRCDSDANCSAGNACVNVSLPNGTLDGVCAPTVSVVVDESSLPVYQNCSAAGDCGTGGDSCVDISIPAENTSGSMCTRTCTTDAECDSANRFSGACYALADKPAMCYQRCDDDTNCATGNSCISVTLPGGTMEGVCVP